MKRISFISLLFVFIWSSLSYSAGLSLFGLKPADNETTYNGTSENQAVTPQGLQYKLRLQYMPIDGNSTKTNRLIVEYLLTQGCTASDGNWTCTGNIVAKSFTSTQSLNIYMDGNLSITTDYMPFLPGEMISNANCSGNCTAIIGFDANSTSDGRQARFRYDDNDTGVFKVCPPTDQTISGCSASECLSLEAASGKYQDIRVCRVTDTSYQFCLNGNSGTHSCVSR